MAVTKYMGNPLDFYQKALSLRAYREQVLASNIANASTPNFKARDFNFTAALQGALGRRGGQLALTRTSPRHLPAGGTANGGAIPLEYQTETQASVDGNTVDMDVERGKFAENSLQFDANLTFINNLLHEMQTAITSQ